MSKKSDHIANSEKDFLRYTENKMSDKERNAFEKNLQKDPFDSEALEGLSTLSPNEIKADLAKMKRGLFQKSDSSNRFVLYRYAAGIAVIITISSLFYFMLNRKIDNNQNTTILTESSEKRNDENVIPEPAKEIPVIPGDTNKVLPAKKTVKPEKIQSTIITEADTEIQAVQAEFHKSKSVDSVPLDSTPVEKKEEQPQFERTSASKSFGERADNKLEIASSAKSPPKAYSGRIVSSDDFQPLPGASVVIKGTNSGTLTDSDGVFMLPPIPITDTSVTLQVAFIGMEEQEIHASAGKDLQIVLNPSEVSLDEVVVVGYGSRRKNKTKESAGVAEDKPAEPMEGQKVFDDYISEHQIFPGKDSTVSDAKVILEFLVDKSGKPYDIKVIMMFPVDASGRPFNPTANEHPGKEFSDEAIRLLTNGPKWKAASPPSFKTRIIITLTKN